MGRSATGWSLPLPPGWPVPQPPGQREPSPRAPTHPSNILNRASKYIPPGWPAGPYPPGPPPNGPRLQSSWLILAGVAILGVITLVVILIVGVNNTTLGRPGPHERAFRRRSQTIPSRRRPAARPMSSGGEETHRRRDQRGQAVEFRTRAADGRACDNQTPNLIGAVGVEQEVPGANQWMMQAEVAITNFVTSMDVAAQASKLMDDHDPATQTRCPLGADEDVVDHGRRHRGRWVDADITIADTARNVKGDSVTIIAVDTKPVTIYWPQPPSAMPVRRPPSARSSGG